MIPLWSRRARDRVVVGIHWSGSKKSTIFDNGPAITLGQGLIGLSEEGNLPERSINSVAKDSARSTRGSRVESVRDPNDIVSMLL